MTTVRLANGVTISGTPSQIREHLETIGFRGDSEWYYSESKGEYLRIRDMQSTHLRNATLKMQKEWLDTLYTIDNPKKYAQAVSEGITNPTFLAMMEELYGRLV